LEATEKQPAEAKDLRGRALALAAHLEASAGESGTSGDELVIHDPATGAAIASLRAGSAADVDRAATAAREVFDAGDWSRLAPIKRAQTLWRAADLIDAHADELVLLEVLDNGKPLRDARAIDIPQSAAHFRYQAAAAARLEGAAPATASFPGLALVTREPVGVVGAITPWNFPLVMAARVLAPALAAGNSVVLKPAEQTPLTALRLGELLREAGLPSGVLEIVPGFGESAGRALVAHPAIDHVAFTGGHDAARQIVHASAERFARLTLELGGKSPGIVLPNADVDAAIRQIVHGAFSNQGQNCCAVTRVLVADDAADAFTERLAAAAKSLRVGAGFAPDVELGPLVSAEHRARVERMIDAAITHGATLAAGGERPGDQPPAGYFLAPTVLDGVTRDSPLAREEVFGPVVFVQRFGDLDEAVAIANDSHYGLAAGIFTRDLDLARRLGRRLEVGTVWVNVYERFDAAVPFSGRKQSGYGQSVGGHGALEEFTALKTYWLAGHDATQAGS
jgi:phenylacetaldehyde dehydrogenase